MSLSRNSTIDPHENLFAKVLHGLGSGIDQYRIIGTTRPGEMLKFQRDSCTYYALYMGDGKAMSIDVKTEQDTEAIICERSLQELRSDGKICVQNHDKVAYTQFRRKARSSDNILGAANFLKDQRVAYEFDFRNSEYYCTLWRYGRGFSTEVAEQAALRGNMGDKDVYMKYKQLNVIN